MIAVIRIKGLVGMKKKTEETLFRLRLRRKYSCVIVNEKQGNIVGMVKRVNDSVSYGKIDKETLTELIKKRGRLEGDEKINEKDTEKIVDLIEKGKMKETKLKPFFRLHPARGGIKSKLHYPKGVLGKNKEINKLIRRML